MEPSGAGVGTVEVSSGMEQIGAGTSQPKWVRIQTGELFRQERQIPVYIGSRIGLEVLAE
jgi:hypothetical protein